jgi:hypothetical protein
MNCEIIDKLISAYIDRELQGDLEPKVRYHLAYCKRCFQTYREMQKTKELLSSLKSRELPDGFWQETRARLRPQAVRPAAVSKRRSSRLWTALAAAACLLLTASMVSLAPDPPSQIAQQAGEPGPITAALPEVHRFVDSDGPVGFMALSSSADRRRTDDLGPLVGAMRISVTQSRDTPDRLSVLDLNRILRSESLDFFALTGDSDAHPDDDFLFIRREEQDMKANPGSSLLVPAGWTGKQ